MEKTSLQCPDCRMLLFKEDDGGDLLFCKNCNLITDEEYVATHEPKNQLIRTLKLLGVK